MKKVLVISSYFPPSSEIGAQRPLKLVRRIKDFGWEPFVLTVAEDCVYPADKNLGRDVLSTVPVIRVPCRSVWHHALSSRLIHAGSQNKSMAFITKYLHIMTKLFPPPVDDLYPWAIAAAQTGASIIKQNNIDLIWTTFPRLSSMYLAWRIWKKTGIPYILDFRDIFYADDESQLPFREKRNIALERKIVQNASGITCVAPKQIKQLLSKHPCLDASRICLVYNWFEASEIQNCAARTFDMPTIIHGGRMYGTRSLNPLFKALALLKQQPVLGESLQFLQFGKLTALEKQLQITIDAHNLAGCVKVLPGVSRQEFLSVCRGARILLVVVGRDYGVQQHSGAIPGKLYDYFAAGRPILVIGPQGCEAGRMVMRLNRGLAVTDDDPEQIADAIQKLASGNGASGKLDLSMESVSEFEASAMVGRMAAFLSDSICKAVAEDT